MMMTMMMAFIYIYIALFSTIDQAHCANVANDSKQEIQLFIACFD